MILAIPAVAAVLLVTAVPIHASASTNQTSLQVHPEKVIPLGLAKISPSGNLTMIPYHTRNHSVHTALKALSTTLQSAKVYTKSQAPLINTGSSALKVQSGGFDGLGQVASGGYAPPDVAVSVGPTDVFEMVNLEGEIWSKSGTAVSSFSLY